jgi:hypothetical protein
MIPDINEGIKDVGKIVDDVVSTGEERDEQLTERLKLDMTSRYWLPQNIRPIIALSLLLTLLGMIISMVLGYTIDSEAWYTVGALNASAIGFYFNSRKQEKIQMTRMKAEVTKAEAAIKIEEIRTKAEVKEDRKEARSERRNARRERRRN